MKSDTELRRDVLDELDWEPSINAAGIGVTVSRRHCDAHWQRGETITRR